MLTKEEFIEFILKGPQKGNAPVAVLPDHSALPEGFEGFDPAEAPSTAQGDTSTFARRLLEASGFGYPELVGRNTVIRSTDAVARYLPDRMSFWPKTPSRPYQTLLFETPLTHKQLLEIPAFRNRKMNHLDIVEDALARLVSEALGGFQQGGESVTADVRKGRKEETLCIISVIDEREGEPVRLVCFGTQNKTTGGLETFQITERTRFWDGILAREHLGLVYERQFRKLLTDNWQEAFTTTEERKQAERLVEICTRKSPKEIDIQEGVLDLLDTIAKGFGLRKKPNTERRLQAFALPPDHDIGIDAEERANTFGGRNPFGGVTLRDERSRLLGYIVYPLATKWDATRLRKHLESNNRFHNVLVIYPDQDEAKLELWQARDQLTGTLRKGQGFRDAAEIVNLLSRFFVVSKAKVRNPTELAQELAYRARYLRRLAVRQLEDERDKGPLRDLYNAFKQSLVHDQSEAEFADAFAQTVTYGLLTARWIGNDHSTATGERFTRLTAMKHLPATSPFLADLFKSVLAVKLDEQRGRLLWLVDDISDLLDRIDVAYVFGAGDAGSESATDPVIHFYEPFLAAYDKDLKNKRGVFFTPKAVVSYIVRSVHDVLQKEFSLTDGLASTDTWGDVSKRNPGVNIPRGVKTTDSFVRILDPATGTGTFLFECIGIIEETVKNKACRELGKDNWDDPAVVTRWAQYVTQHLLQRLYGYELMMASYAVAHLKLSFKLKQSGYHIGSGDRLRVFLTNSLEPPSDVKQEALIGTFPALADEAKAVNDLKRHQHFTVVIGNPPYSKSSQNQDGWIEALMEEYKRTVRTAETQIQALSDDYVKFLRLGHFSLERSQAGVLGVITNNGFLDGPLFRDMRGSLLSSFDGIRILNLHGDLRKQFLPPDGQADENVFDIQQGVATSVFWKKQVSPGDVSIGYAELWGSRQERYRALQNTSVIHVAFEPLQPTPPFYLFIPVSKRLEVEFNRGWHLYNIFGTGNGDVDNHESYGAGFVTQQDSFAIGFTKDEIADNVRAFLDSRTPDKALWERFHFCSTNQWSFERAKKELKVLDIQRITKRCLYRPFDYRFTVFDRNICTIIRKRITSQFDSPNVALLTTRRVTRLPFNNVFVTDHAAEYKVASHDRNTIVFPLWIQQDEESGTEGLFDKNRRLNFNAEFLRAVATQLNVPSEPKSGLPKGLAPEDVFYYIYAVAHSPAYRDRYGEFLKIDFLRVPLATDMELFRTLAKCGRELSDLHLLKSAKLGNSSIVYTGPVGPRVEKVSHVNDTVWLDKAKSQGFVGVPTPVWNFQIGGYQVCDKWLKDRRSSTLSKSDIEHYRKILTALNETIRVMNVIDDVVTRYGGWPNAFITAAKESNK